MPVTLWWSSGPIWAPWPKRTGSSTLGPRPGRRRRLRRARRARILARHWRVSCVIAPPRGVMAHNLVCWKCGADLAALPLPLSRRDACARCRAELHVCRMCVDYDEHVAKKCREPIAEEVSDKTRANFCDYFAPRPAAYVAPETAAAERARAELARLFGGKS